MIKTDLPGPRRTPPRASLLMFIALLIAGSGLRLAGANAASGSQVLTPLILSVQDAPVPFIGSDGRTHLVYELWMTNFISLTANVNQVAVIGDGQTLFTMDASRVAGRLQPAGQRTASGVIQSGGVALLFIHLVLDRGRSAPPSHLTRSSLSFENSCAIAWHLSRAAVFY